ncbi:MAG: EamA family transporter [Betaproteobacteria bacterium]
MHLGEFTTRSFADIYQYSVRLAFNPFVLGGVVALFFAFFTWLILISKVDLSFAQPMTSLVFVTIPLCSSWILNENLNWNQLVGIALIVAGVFIVSE